jgi:hypothetical protein
MTFIIPPGLQVVHWSASFLKESLYRPLQYYCANRRC